MLMGHVEGLPKVGLSKDLLLANPVSETGLNGSDEEAETREQILYMASFDEHGSKVVQYDTIIWLFISLLLVLAWGVGIIMLLYLPIRRYILWKDVSSRKLFVTPSEIVYKVSRPSFIPFCGVRRKETRTPLSLVIDVIIEQGYLQSTYGIHTVRIGSIARGKAAPVDELQVQGVYNPGELRKVIVIEASKAIQSVGRSWKPVIVHSIGSERVASTEPSSEIVHSPYSAALGNKDNVSSDLLLHKLEEVNKSVRKIELLIKKSQPSSKSEGNSVSVI